MDNDATSRSEPGLEKSLHGYLNMRVEHRAKDRIVVTMPVDWRVHQPMGLLHGGASVALAETAASIGGNENTGEGMVALGQEINANHLRSKSEGMLRAVAVPVHIGRRTQVWTVEIRDEAQKLICVARCTLAVVEAPGPVPSFATGA